MNIFRRSGAIAFSVGIGLLLATPASKAARNNCISSSDSQRMLQLIKYRSRITTLRVETAENQVKESHLLLSGPLGPRARTFIATILGSFDALLAGILIGDVVGVGAATLFPVLAEEEMFIPTVIAVTGVGSAVGVPAAAREVAEPEIDFKKMALEVSTTFENLEKVYESFDEVRNKVIDATLAEKSRLENGGQLLNYLTLGWTTVFYLELQEASQLALIELYKKELVFSNDAWAGLQCNID